MDQHRLNRIQFLSRRFNELKGLRVAFAGLCLAVGMGSYLAAASPPTDDGARMALLVSYVPVVPGLAWLTRYYASTFGRQVSTPAPRWPLLLIIPFFWFLWYFNARFPSIPVGTEAATIVAVASAWVAIRDWPWRGYYFIATAAVMLTYAASASGAGFLAPGTTVGAAYAAVGSSMVLIGLLDHFLLVRLVKEVRASHGLVNGAPGL